MYIKIDKGKGGERERESGLLLKIQTNYICIEKLPQIVLGPLPPPFPPSRKSNLSFGPKPVFWIRA